MTRLLRGGRGGYLNFFIILFSSPWATCLDERTKRTCFSEEEER